MIVMRTNYGRHNFKTLLIITLGLFSFSANATSIVCHGYTPRHLDLIIDISNDQGQVGSSFSTDNFTLHNNRVVYYHRPGEAGEIQVNIEGGDGEIGCEDSRFAVDGRFLGHCDALK